MRLHQNKELLKDAILATAEYLEMRDIYVEKDYWVTVALYEIFHSNIADQSVFKGGTSLSKCHKLIERFSEDIDLVVLRNNGENDTQLNKKIRAISKAVEQIIPEIPFKGLTNKKGNIRKTVHQYHALFDGDFGQVRERLVVEATWLGHFEPFSEMQVSSYVYDMMKARGQYDLIEHYQMAPFTIQVLSKLRTFCEKIMSLVRFSRTADPIADLRNKIRHVYDLHQMLRDQEIQQFFASTDFDGMLIRVGNDDMISYKNNNGWISIHPAKAIVFDKPEETWVQIRTAYNGEFKDLVTGHLPAEAAVVGSLKQIAARLQTVVWSLP
jgi:predicted nucleotidyltransferase component of viral defense system